MEGPVGLRIIQLRILPTMSQLVQMGKVVYDCGSMARAAQTEIFITLKEMGEVHHGDHKRCLYQVNTILQ